MDLTASGLALRLAMRLNAGVTRSENELAADLLAAASGGKLSAVFQPQIELQSGRIVAAEALCRWVHHSRGPVSPEEFIPLAERTGSIHAIGQFMIEACFTAAERWSATAPSIEISVNVSPVQLTAGFVDTLSTMWREREFPVQALTLEITESVQLADVETELAHLAALRDEGIGISLDDYGTGHASMEQFDRFPVTEVKVDRSLIQEHATSAASEVERIVEAAHRRGLRVVAEGIETADQLRFASELGCDRGQGYLLGMPMPDSRLESILVSA
jgi:EAL domain-containing protein (putative c-di-GMP-specific phosphodiesterase class I)